MVNALAELVHVSAVPREGSWQPTLKPRTWPTPEKEEVESALDKVRPPSLPSRRSSYFAFATLAECVHYADTEQIGPERYFYRVRILQPARAPITLTHVPDRLLQYRDAIFRHYWAADDGWNVYEYFGDRIIMVGSYGTDGLPDTGPVIAKLMADRKRLAEVAPKLPT